MRKQLKKEEQPQVVESEPLHVKYRPKTLKEVVGQDAVVKSLEAALKKGTKPHCYLFTGPAGTGKTTLSRIVAASVGCGQIIEVDAASNSGIDAMREVTSSLRYHGFGQEPNKAIIIDECHGLSKQAWDALLKSTEEPPPHVFFFFCTTVEGKVPATMVTRSLAYNLKPVKYDDLMDVLEDVCESEKLETSEKVLGMVAKACEGSVRGALTMLAKVADCEDPEEAAVLLETPLENGEVIDLCRQLVKGALRWADVTKALKSLDMPAESIRIVIVSYLSSCLLGASTDKQALRLLDILHCFSKPCNPTDKMAPLLLAFGQFAFPE